ncbi:hypothetical protein Ga0100231_013365 [Opitutaceae bacterium TAV4]|nr:hypothetical protein Ga0100231_013365 [Opitutaceae bacterium TAV4]RRJ99405.1 hypothetical protein Ga0100230_014675 [Opitutaceae bacterium TAV3]
MITRPLDLASRLRNPPHSYDAFYYVNIGLILLFFGLFGSRFILFPGLATDFKLPETGTSMAGAQMTDVVIAVPRHDMALVDGEVRTFKQLQEGNWLRERIAGRPGARLLVQAGASVSAADLAQLYAIAAEAGFAGVVLAAEMPVEHEKRPQ